MVKVIFVSLLSISLSAVAANMKRNPNSLSDDLSASLEQGSRGIAHASVTFSENILGSMKTAADGMSELVQGSANASRNVAIVGWHMSENAAGFVMTSSENTSKVVSNAGKYVITSTGEILQGSFDRSKNAVSCSVDFAKDVSGKVSEVVVKVGEDVIGSVKVSVDTSKRVFEVGSESALKAGKWFVDASGNLIHSSGVIIGKVVHVSGQVVGWMVDKSGKILTVSGDASFAVVRGVSGALKQFASDAWEVSKGAGQAVGGSVRASANGAFMVIEASGKSVRVVSRSISDIFSSSKVER